MRPQQEDDDQMGSSQEPGGIFWLFGEGWDGAESRKIFRMEKLWVPAKFVGALWSFPKWSFPALSPGQCHKIALLTYRKNLSSRVNIATLKILDLSILPSSSQTQKLEGVCPGQSCSGLWLISGLRFSPLTFANQAVLTQHVRVIQSRRAVTSHGLFFIGQRRAWFIRNIFWSNHFRSQGNAV